MKLHGRLLSDDERTRVHRDSLKILTEVGVKYNSRKALEVLKRNGAKIDTDRMLAHIPEEMVDEALRRAPKSFVLGGRNPAYDCKLPSDYSIYNLDAGGMHFIDHVTGERRPGHFQDHIDILKVFQAMDMGNLVWTHSVDDIPEHKLDTVLMSIETMKYTSKHLQDELLFPEEVDFLMEALVELTGSEEEAVRRKNLFGCLLYHSPADT